MQFPDMSQLGKPVKSEFDLLCEVSGKIFPSPFYVVIAVGSGHAPVIQLHNSESETMTSWEPDDELSVTENVKSASKYAHYMVKQAALRTNNDTSSNT